MSVQNQKCAGKGHFLRGRGRNYPVECPTSRHVTTSLNWINQVGTLCGMRRVRGTFHPPTQCRFRPWWPKYQLDTVVDVGQAHESISGVARTSPLLGHSMGTLRLYELPCKVQKLIGGSGGILPPKNVGILQPPRSVLRLYTVAKCKSLTANSRTMSVWDS